MTDKKELLIEAKALQSELLWLLTRLSGGLLEKAKRCSERTEKIVEYFNQRETPERFKLRERDLEWLRERYITNGRPAGFYEGDENE